jgi:uncharacterized membrane protein
MGEKNMKKYLWILIATVAAMVTKASIALAAHPRVPFPSQTRSSSIEGVGSIVEVQTILMIIQIALFALMIISLAALLADYLRKKRS